MYSIKNYVIGRYEPTRISGSTYNIPIPRCLLSVYSVLSADNDGIVYTFVFIKISTVFFFLLPLLTIINISINFIKCCIWRLS